VDSSPSRCPECGTEVAAELRACPSCARLIHSDRLKALAAQAQAAEQGGDVSAALAAWRDTLDLLPPESRQHATILEKVRCLSERVDQGGAGPKPSGWKKGVAGLGALALILVKFKSVLVFLLTKGKFLLLGLTKGPTLFSMLLFLGVYWSIWGWKFAAGFVVSIYIHEMGHVWMLHRYGIRASAPMFIPGLGALVSGLGALVRLNQHPATVVEDARVGLAGPIWGMGAAAAAYAAYVATGNELWGAIAQAGGMINLFNLIPVWQLDGGRGFASLTRGQRWIAAAAVGVMYYVTGDVEGHASTHRQNVFLIIIGLCAVGRAAVGEAPKKRDDFGLFQYVLLILTLSALAAIEIPLLARQQ
jgi:Zn-dependent protease